MFLQHLTVSSFQGVPGFDAALAPLTLFTGDNGAGKTSLLQAIRFALTAQVDRVDLKKDYPLLVTEGARKATVRVVLGTGESVDATLPTGKHVNPLDPGSPAALALDPPAFMRLSPDERRTLLYSLAGDMGDVVTMTRRRLLDACLPPPMVDAILPSLRAGFPAAHAQAVQRATEARASWRGVTGEAYGVQKAEGWAPSTPVVAPSEAEIAQAKAELEDAKQAVLDASERVGAAQAGLDPEQRRALQAQADAVPGLQDNVAEGQAELKALEAERDALADTAAQTSGVCFECPCCNASLRYAAGQVTQRTADTAESAAAAVRLADLTRSVASTQQKLGTVQARLRQAVAAQERLQAAGALPDALDTTDLQAALQDAQARESAAHDAMHALRQRYAAVEAMAKKAQEAAGWHEKAKQWTEIAAVLAPDGLPSELLGWALKPVNEALRRGPEGWPLVQLRGDMVLTVSGRPYSLCSESEQWRADVLMATWLANKSEARLVLADRMDVLHPSARLPFLRWVAESEAQFIVAATLQKAPALDYAAVYWIGDAGMERAA